LPCAPSAEPAILESPLAVSLPERPLVSLYPHFADMTDAYCSHPASSIKFPPTLVSRLRCYARKKPSRPGRICLGCTLGDDDGQDFRAVIKLPDGGAPEHTVSFPPATAKFFRVVFKPTPAPPLPPWASGLDPASLGIKVGPRPTDYEITELVLRPGARVNRFEEKAVFKVTHAWVNRLIGDQQPDVTTKYTFADVKPYKANSPLLPSGLLGPVQLYSVVRR